MRVAELVDELAKKLNVTVDRTAVAYVDAVAFSRLASVEGDPTLDMLAELSSKKFITIEAAVQLAAAYSLEFESIPRSELGGENDTARSARGLSPG